MTAAPDTTAPATLAGIRERSERVTAANLNADAFGGGVYARLVRLASDDAPLLLAAIEALSTALQRHREWFTDSKGVMLCGGCLKPVPCPDDPDMIVERALNGKDSSDGEAL